MARTRGERIWVAVRVERGFVTEIKAFGAKEPALKQERCWRRKMNPDYDETGIGRVSIGRARRSTRLRARAKTVAASLPRHLRV